MIIDSQTFPGPSPFLWFRVYLRFLPADSWAFRFLAGRVLFGVRTIRPRDLREEYPPGSVLSENHFLFFVALVYIRVLPLSF